MESPAWHIAGAQETLAEHVVLGWLGVREAGRWPGFHSLKLLQLCSRMQPCSLPWLTCKGQGALSKADCLKLPSP